MSRQKRILIGTGIMLVAFGVLGKATALWYQSHYVMPPMVKRTVVLPNPNGYDTLREALKLEVKQKEGVVVSPRPIDINESPARYPQQPLAGRQKLLTANRASIEKTREALQQEYLVPPEQSDAQSLDTYPSLATYREQARMLHFAAHTYADSGNLPEAMQCALDAVEMGTRIPRGGSVTHTLVGQACESIGGKAVWELVDRVDARTARLAATRLEKLEEKRWPMIETLAEECEKNNRVFLPMVFQKNFKDTWDGTEILFNDTSESDSENSEQAKQQPTLTEKAQTLWQRAKVIYYGPRTVVDNSERWVKALRAGAATPWGAPHASIPEPTAPVNQLSTSVVVLSNTKFKEAFIITASVLQRVYLALRAYQLKHNSYPQALEQLVSGGYLKAIPVDPFSPTRAPLHYRKAGKAFTLWSVGPDAKDDNGKPITDKYWMKEGKYLPGDAVARISTY